MGIFSDPLMNMVKRMVFRVTFARLSVRLSGRLSGHLGYLQWHRAALGLVTGLCASLALTIGPAFSAGSDAPRAVSPDLLPQHSLSSIVGIDDEQISCFMGGANNGNILKAEELAKKFSGPMEYRLYSLDGAGETATAVALPVNEGSEGECADLWRHEMAFDPRKAGRFSAALFPANPGRNPLPEVLESLKTPQPEHVALVTAFLKRRNVATPDVRIVQTVRTDLDGDGHDDWIINAVRHQPDKARKGDYSIILVLRGLESGTRTYIVQDEVTLDDSPYPSILWVNKIVSVLDVDGDGAYEIILTGAYIYGGGWEVIRFQDGSFEHVLFCGCDG